jgi:hypothetical protein
MKEKQRIPRSVVLVVAAVFFVCAFNLYDIALQTGNFRGMWVTLLHMVIVAVGACGALREPLPSQSVSKE